jgi:hypothetical protein
MWRALSKKRWQVWAEGWVQVWVQVWVQGRIERLEEVMAPCWSLGRREERGEAWLEEGRRGGRREYKWIQRRLLLCVRVKMLFQGR